MRNFLSLGFVLSLCIGCGGGSGPGTSGGTGGTSGTTGGSGGVTAGGTGGAGTGGASATGTGGSTTNPDAAMGGTGGAMGGADAGSEAGGAGTVTCGTAQPDVTGITGAEGLVIGPDGTIYFSQSQAVGRLRPGAGMMPEKAWAKLTGAATVWGVAYDGAAKALYAGSPTTKTVYKITLEDTPTVTPLITMTGSPNGFTMGPDGALYYSDQTGGNVDRVASGATTKTTVNTTALVSPNGVGFGPDGALYVLQYSAGSIVKLTLSNGMETMRTVFVMNGLGNDDGIAFDKSGNLYIGFSGGLSKVSAADKTVTHLMGMGASANVEFGAGALSCKDIYFVNGGKLLRYTNDIEGAVVPWHVM